MDWSSRKCATAFAAVLVLVGGCRSAPAPDGYFPDTAAFQRPEAEDRELRELVRKQTELQLAEPADWAAWKVLEGRARALAARFPDWVVPARLVDDLERAALLGPWAWARRTETYGERTTAEAAYLLGRLETTRRAGALFEEAARLGPELAWGHHGVAWQASEAGAYAEANQVGRRAAKNVDSDSEALVVGRVLAASLAASGQHEEARALLRELAALPGLLDSEVAAVQAAELASRLLHPKITMILRGLVGSNGPSEVIQKRSGGSEEARKLLLDALTLLGPKSALSDTDLGPLVSAVRDADLERDRGQVLGALIMALEGRTGCAARTLVDGLIRDREAETYGRLLGPGPSGFGPLDPEEWRAAVALDRGDLATWLATWRARLPVRLLQPVAEADAAAGVPFAGAGLLALIGDEQLAAGGPPQGAEALRAAGILCDAGWFEAARIVLARSGALDQPEARALATRLEARSFLATELAALSTATSGPESEGKLGLDGFLEQAAALLASGLQAAFGPGDARGSAGGRIDPASVRTSARESYGPFASLLQPGPREAPRVGAAPLDGLAALAQSLGRMAIVGAEGRRSDATVRSVIATEYVRGTHLGAPYEGTVFWCQGVDVPSRAERSGAGIAGAAVHAGYWVDIESMRREARTWLAVGEAYGGLTAPFPPAPACAPTERDRRVPLLGEGRRLTLAVIRDRGPASFDELLDLVALHEEGHLCDRARFLPLSAHWPAALGLLVRVQFRPAGLMQRLEYRAELTSLCEAPDPRLVMVEILNLAEDAEARPGDRLTPHGAAYVDLLNDLTGLADERPEELGLAPGRYLRWQWHTLAPERLRTLALELARREGLEGK